MTVYLADELFRTVVAATPLISIDLVVASGKGDILLGRRNNRPAQGFWFVPGGRILKNERLDDAFARLTKGELGIELPRTTARLLGVYEHLYRDSIFGESPDTHYVVLGYHLRLELEVEHLPTVQHQEYRWWPAAEMAVSEQVHGNSRAYLSALR